MTIELHVDDFARVEAFYTRLGFKEAWKQDADDHKGYLVMTMEDNVIRFWCGNETVQDHPYFKTFPADAPLGKGVELVFTTSNLEKLYETFKDDPALLQPLKKKPWGLSDFRLRDPYGYYLRITSPHDIVTRSWIIP